MSNTASQTEKPAHQQFRLRAGAYAFGGDAVARLPTGQVVFVRGGIPGEDITIKIDGVQRGVLRAHVEEIHEPAQERVVPPCPYFDRCGGCHLQYLAYDSQLASKQQVVESALRRATKLSHVPMLDPVAAPSPWQYRSTAQYHVDKTGDLGYLHRRSSDVVAIDRCAVAHPAINTARTTLEAVFKEHLSLLDGSAAIEQVAIRVGVDGTRVEHLIVFFGDIEARPTAERLAVEYAARSSGMRGCWLVTAEAGRAGVVQRSLLVGRATLRQRIGHIVFRIGPTVFFQVHLTQAENLVDIVRQRITSERAERVLDLYAGVGLFSLSVADLVGHVDAVDSSEDAIDLGRESAMENGITNVHFHTASAETALEGHLRHDMVLLDPRRSGCSPRVLAQLAAASPRTIVYVSCDPSTLARDARALLEKGYQLESAQVVDLFPQTYHVETVATLQRAQTGRP